MQQSKRGKSVRIGQERREKEKKKKGFLSFFPLSSVRTVEHNNPRRFDFNSVRVCPAPSSHPPNSTQPQKDAAA